MIDTVAAFLTRYNAVLVTSVPNSAATHPLRSDGQKIPRVALITDSFYEVNGVARVSREFGAYARERSLPLLCIHAGPCRSKIQDGSVTAVEFPRSPLRMTLDGSLAFDFLISRHATAISTAITEFGADLIHITGPGDFGMVAAYLSHKLHIPLFASWHTNLHEYAGQRLAAVTSFLPARTRDKLRDAATRQALYWLLKFHQIPRVIFAPNEDLVSLIHQRLRRQTYLMPHGVDTELFSPEHRSAQSRVFTLGYVGRLTPEKNVRLLAEIERKLLLTGCGSFRFLVVGDGLERHWLENNLKTADFTGFLSGVDLAGAYSQMDLLFFPSETETFGLVVIEAMASGVPVVVSDVGGPKYQVRHGVDGFVARNADCYVAAARHLMGDPAALLRMREAARYGSSSRTWTHTFDELYSRYALWLASADHERYLNHLPASPH
jgi:phosphatidylinositol alpha 1,6-mannosyltransferase